MSRIGESPILIPTDVTVEKTGQELVVKGPKGSLQLLLQKGVEVVIKDSIISIKRKDDTPKIKALHGLTRSLIANMIIGVTQGFEKKLELVGVGFRVVGGGDKLTLNIGFSHPVEIIAPTGIIFEVTDNTKIKVSGIDKGLVGQVAANIKKIKPPDVYKGKGIRYEGEYIRKKPGKAGKVGVTAQ